MSNEIERTCKWIQLGPKGECKRRRRGGHVGKKNQVVERKAGTSVNLCDSLRTEKQIKENHQYLPSQKRSIVG